nr:hypothetical protein [uncultured Ruminococcus sp.]
MKKVIALLLTMALLLSAFAITASAANDTEIDGGYYIVFKGDDYRVHQRNRLHAEFGRWVIRGVTLSTSTPFKIAYSQDLDTVTKLYPEGEGSDYISRYNSRWMTVEFTPDGSNEGDSTDMAWYDSYVSAYPCEPPQEDSTEYIPVTDQQIKRNLYEDALTRFRPNWKNWHTYEEVYYHADPRFGNVNQHDWVLVSGYALQPIEGIYYGVFDDVVVYSSEYSPFAFGYGVYDCAEDTYYSIAEAWDRGYADLHDVFLNRVRSESTVDLLGDADHDGELTIIDVTMIQRYLIGVRDLDESSWWFKHYGNHFGARLTSLADYDANGTVNAVDATRIQRALIGNPLYSHSFTADVTINKDVDGKIIAQASSSFGSGQVQYQYRIEGSVYAASVYGSDFGKFYLDDVNPEPGNFQITTGYIGDSSVELPVTSLTYNDHLTLTVTARDALGNITPIAVFYMKNVY